MSTFEVTFIHIDSEPTTYTFRDPERFFRVPFFKEKFYLFWLEATKTNKEVQLTYMFNTSSDSLEKWSANGYVIERKIEKREISMQRKNIVDIFIGLLCDSRKRCTLSNQDLTDLVDLCNEFGWPINANGWPKNLITQT